MQTPSDLGEQGRVVERVGDVDVDIEVGRGLDEQLHALLPRGLEARRDEIGEALRRRFPQQ
jgi:hypothetical protein